MSFALICVRSAVLRSAVILACPQLNPTRRRPLRISRRLPPGVYEVNWHLVGVAGQVTIAPGSVELRANEQPLGIVQGPELMDWVGDVNGGLLSEFAVDVLSGEVESGEWINLVEVTASAFPFEARAFAAAALVGDEMLSKRGVAVDALRLQVAGLYDVCVNASETTGLLGRKSGVTASVIIDSSDTSPIQREARAIELAFDRPRVIRDAIGEFVEPLRRIFSIASGKAQPITALSVGVAAEDFTRPPVWFDVFGRAIGQAVEWRIPDIPAHNAPALVLGPGEPDLLDMLATWKELDQWQHPLVEIYGNSIYGESHPRSRFLFIVQTIEGTWGIDNRASRAHDVDQYRLDRATALRSISGSGLEFVRDNLRSRPAENLAEKLRASCAEFVVEIEHQLQQDGGVVGLIRDEEDIRDGADAVRVMRNGLSHGDRTFDRSTLRHVAGVLERAVRRLLLRRLGASEDAQRRATNPAPPG